MPDAILVIVTCASPAEAQTLAEAAVAERLAACGNVMPGARSVFRWQGKVCRESETVLLLKTRRELFEPLRARMRELHSYDVPEIIALPILAGDADYLKWIEQETAP